MRRLLWWLVSPPQGTSITVSRPTTQDGETVQLTTTARVGASALELKGEIERCALAIQAHLKASNDRLRENDIQIAHKRWLDISAKVEKGFRLSKEEMKWWNRYRTHFTEAGPVALADVKGAASDTPPGDDE